jgi:hypothetical protein
MFEASDIPACPPTADTKICWHPCSVNAELS